MTKNVRQYIADCFTFLNRRIIIRIAVYCGSGLGKSPIYAEKAAELGTALAKTVTGLSMVVLKQA